MQAIGLDNGYRIKGDLKISGSLQVIGMDTELFTLAELALIDIIPKIMETHPDLYLKYIDMIPVKK